MATQGLLPHSVRMVRQWDKLPVGENNRAFQGILLEVLRQIPPPPLTQREDTWGHVAMPCASENPTKEHRTDGFTLVNKQAKTRGGVSVLINRQHFANTSFLEFVGN